MPLTCAGKPVPPPTVATSSAFMSTLMCSEPSIVLNNHRRENTPTIKHPSRFYVSRPLHLSQAKRGFDNLRGVLPGGKEYGRDDICRVGIKPTC